MVGSTTVTVKLEVDTASGGAAKAVTGDSAAIAVNAVIINFFNVVHPLYVSFLYLLAIETIFTMP